MNKRISFLLSMLGLPIFCSSALSLIPVQIYFSPSGSLPATPPSSPATSPNSSPSTTTLPSADSRIVPPLGTTQRPATTQYPGATVPTQYVSDEKYDSVLPACPATPACPDINGNMPSGVAVNCPASCTITRTVIYQDPNNTDSRILNTRMPLCPTNYTSVAVYKMGREIVMATQNEYAPFPIGSLATYNNYVTAGYDCSQLVYDVNNVAADCYFKNSDFTSNQVVMINGYVGKYYSYYDDGKDWSIGSNCGIPAVSQYAYRNYSVRWKYVQCFRAAGSLYYTDNMAPTGIVCSHVQPGWQTHN